MQSSADTRGVFQLASQLLYQNLGIYTGCDIQCQYSDRSICNIGTQITKIHNIYIHIPDITSRIHIHIWGPPGRLNGGGSGGADAPQESYIYIYITLIGPLASGTATFPEQESTQSHGIAPRATNKLSCGCFYASFVPSEMNCAFR